MSVRPSKNCQVSPHMGFKIEQHASYFQILDRKTLQRQYQQQMTKQSKIGLTGLATGSNFQRKIS